MLSVLANRTYRHLSAAQVIALIGTGMMTVALSLLAYKIAGDKAGAVLAQAKAEAGSIALLSATRQNIAFLNAMLRATFTTRSNDKCPHPCGLKLFLTQ
jgi:hypothetical protein